MKTLWTFVLNKQIMGEREIDLKKPLILPLKELLVFLDLIIDL
jgi:hypothetical protein